MATIRQPLTRATAPESPQSSVRFDWIMALVSIWWMGGLFVDAWAHSNVPQLETFFTPWHAVLYSGSRPSATVSSQQQATWQAERHPGL